jgi:hypothetical protein
LAVHRRTFSRNSEPSIVQIRLARKEGESKRDDSSSILLAFESSCLMTWIYLVAHQKVSDQTDMKPRYGQYTSLHPWLVRQRNLRLQLHYASMDIGQITPAGHWIEG